MGYSPNTTHSFSKWDNINPGTLVRVCRSSRSKYSSHSGTLLNSYITVNGRRVRIELYVFVGFDGYEVSLYSSGGVSVIGKDMLIFVGIET